MSKFNWIVQLREGVVIMCDEKPIVLLGNNHWSFNPNGSRSVVHISGKRNPNWKDSLIDLSKNDYIIRDGVLMATRKHATLIHAWADGAEIQFKCDDDKWDDTDNPCWDDDAEYRIKPTTKTVVIRNYISRTDRKIKVASNTVPSDLDEWIGDWQEVEI